jgi:NifB/MoaA-like Fe-S oxidoreductase
MSATPETDRIARLLENLDEWIDDSLRKSKPIGLTLCAARSTIADHRARITEMWDALETLRRERDEARAVAYDLAVIASHCLGSHGSALLTETSERIADTLKRWRELKQ